ncbi:MAG: DMT family transporter [Sulfurospirillaceae bacterium]
MISLPKSHKQAQFYVITATILISGSFFASQKLVGTLTPAALTLLRFIIAALLLAPFVLLSPNRRSKLFTTLPRAFIISLFYSLYFMIMFEALKTTTVLNTGTIYTLVPFATALLSYFIFKEKIDKKRLFAFLIGAVGTLWVIFEGNLELFLKFNLQEGDGLFFFGSLSMCIYSILLKALYKNDDLLVLVFSTLLGGIFWMSIGTLYFKTGWGSFSINIEFIFCLLYLAIATTIVTLYLLQSATVVLGPVKVMSYVYLNPIIVAVLMLFLEGKSIPLVLIPGILLSVLATFMLQLSKSKKGA